MEAAIDLARQSGLLDLGMEDIRADRIDCVNIETVHADAGSGLRRKPSPRYPLTLRFTPSRRTGWWATRAHRRSGYVGGARDTGP